jgi:hypothetical protein
VGPGVEESGKRNRIEDVAECPSFAGCLGGLLNVSHSRVVWGNYFLGWDVNLKIGYWNVKTIGVII